MTIEQTPDDLFGRRETASPPQHCSLGQEVFDIADLFGCRLPFVAPKPRFVCSAGCSSLESCKKQQGILGRVSAYIVHLRTTFRSLTRR